MAYGFNDDKTKADVYTKSEVYKKSEVYAKSEVYTKSEVVSLLSGLLKIEDYSFTVTNVGAGQRLTGSHDITVYSGYKPIGILQIDNISNGANVERIHTYQNDTKLQYSVYNFSAATINVTFTARVLYVNNSIL